VPAHPSFGWVRINEVEFNGVGNRPKRLAIPLPIFERIMGVIGGFLHDKNPLRCACPRAIKIAP